MGSLRNLGDGSADSDKLEHPDTTTLNIVESVVKDFYNRLPQEVELDSKFGADAFRLIESLLSIFKTRH